MYPPDPPPLAADVPGPARKARGKPILWLAVVLQLGGVYLSLRLGNYLFAVGILALVGLLVQLAWRGEPARGSGRAKLMWGLLLVSGMLMVALLIAGAG